MSSLIEHPFLQHLPLELMNNFDRNTFKEFLRKKVRSFFRLEIIMIIAFILYCILLYWFETVHTSIAELEKFDNIFNLSPLVIFLILAVIFHILKKKYNLPENEIDSAVEELKSQRIYG